MSEYKVTTKPVVYDAIYFTGKNVEEVVEWMEARSTYNISISRDRDRVPGEIYYSIYHGNILVSDPGWVVFDGYRMSTYSDEKFWNMFVKVENV